MIAFMDELQANCVIELPSGAPPDWIQLMPSGDVKARDGRKWKLADASAVINQSLKLAGQTDLVIDYEHQTDLAAINGQSAPAAGWIQQLENRAGAIWAKVNWNQRASELITKREYRYISPTFSHDKAGKVLTILRAALTNSPALEMPALAKTQKEKTMEANGTKKILTALNLKDDATEADIDQALASIQKPNDLSEVATVVGLEAGATKDEVIAKATSLAAEQSSGVDPSAYVSRCDFDTVAKQLATLQEQNTIATATTAVNDAVNAGKIAPAQRDWAMAYAKKDIDGFVDYAKMAPVIVAPGEITNKPPADPDAALSKDEIAICKSLGIGEDKFKEAKKQEIANASAN